MGGWPFGHAWTFHLCIFNGGVSAHHRLRVWSSAVPKVLMQFYFLLFKSLLFLFQDIHSYPRTWWMLWVKLPSLSFSLMNARDWQPCPFYMQQSLNAYLLDSPTESSWYKLDSWRHSSGSGKSNLVCGVPSRIPIMNDRDVLQTLTCWALVTDAKEGFYSSRSGNQPVISRTVTECVA